MQVRRASRRVFALTALAMPLPVLLGLGGGLQALQSCIPKGFEKSPHLGDSLRSRTVETARAIPALVHQPRLLEHPQVLRNGRTRDIEVRGDRSSRQLLPPDQAQDLAPAWFGDRSQGGFQFKDYLSIYLRKCQLT